MNIVLVTPAAARSRAGNRHTAARWAGFLRADGHRVQVVTNWDGRRNDLMIALHARRSHHSILRFRRTTDGQALVVVLTGTDLYRDIRVDPDAQQSLELADRIVVLQELGALELPPHLREKTRVIFQSATPRAAADPPTRRFRVAVIGHLREEKDPFRAGLALRYLTDLPNCEVLHVGEALSQDMAVTARTLMRTEPRYRWIGGVPHWLAIRHLARSNVLVVSSHLEGGANVIAEAVRVGVPVIASRVSGNVGMLGPGYPGYYPVGDEHRLARLIRSVYTDTSLRDALKRAGAVRRSLFSPQAERLRLRNLMAEFDSPRPRRSA